MRPNIFVYLLNDCLAVILITEKVEFMGFTPLLKKKALGAGFCLLVAMTLSGVTNADSFTESNEVLRTPGVGIHAGISHPPTPKERATCSFVSDSEKDEKAGLKPGAFYMRLLWQDIETSDDVFDLQMLEEVLDCAHKKGKAIDFRVQLAWPNYPKYHNKSRGLDPNKQYSMGLPDWLKEKRGFKSKQTTIGSPEQPPYMLADWDNKVFWREHAELIKTLGDAFDGHKALNSIDIGSVGFWGEWHYDLGPKNRLGQEYLPSVQKQKEIIDLYKLHFKNTPKIALEDSFNRLTFDDVGAETARYVMASEDIGWRGDSWGSKYFNGRYDKEQKNIIPDLWKKGNISIETSADFYHWESDPSDFDRLKRSLAFAENWHTSRIHTKSGYVPDAFIVPLRSLAKKLGFRFVLRSASHDSAVSAGDVLNVKMGWQNKGIAPSYRDFRVAFRLKNSAGEVVKDSSVISSLSIKGWLPNPTARDKVVSFDVPRSVRTGDYTLETALVFHAALDTTLPVAVEEANNADNWLPIGPLTITKGQSKKKAQALLKKTPKTLPQQTSPRSDAATMESGFVRVVAGGVESTKPELENYNDKVWQIIGRDGDAAWSNDGEPSRAYVDLYLDAKRQVSSVQYADDFARLINIGVFTKKGAVVHIIKNIETKAGTHTIRFPEKSAAGKDVIGDRVLVWSDSKTGFKAPDGKLWFAPNKIKVFGNNVK